MLQKIVIRWRSMKRLWKIEELIEHFTLMDEEKEFLENKTGAARKIYGH